MGDTRRMLMAFFAAVLVTGIVLVDAANRIAARAHPNYQWRPLRGRPRPLPRRYYATVVAGGSMVGCGAAYLSDRFGLVTWIFGCLALIVVAWIVGAVRNRSVRPRPRAS
jgi:hypothetical protein